MKKYHMADKVNPSGGVSALCFVKPRAIDLSHALWTNRKRVFAQGEMTEFRKKLGLSQADFWTPLGVTQSAGSRYENTNRTAPQPVVTLIDLMYGNEPLATLAKLRGVTVDALKQGK